MVKSLGIETRLRWFGLVAKSCPTLATPWMVACQAPCPCDFPGKNTVVGCHFLLHGMFLEKTKPKD